MHRSQQQQRNDNSEILPPSSKLDRIDELLQDQLAYFPAKELSAQEIANWHNDLKAYSIKAIEWAFECHRRAGRFFPLPADIFEYLANWEPEPEWWGFDLPRGREPLCDEWPTVLALFQMVTERVQSFKDKKQTYVRLTEAEGRELYAKAKAKIEASIQKGEKAIAAAEAAAGRGGTNSRV